MNYKNFILLILLCFCSFQSRASASDLIHADGQYFKDAQGRVVLLRGMNVSNSGKIPPFDPMPDLSMIQKMRDWGINNIRLAFIWEAFEPEVGRYNYAYLDRLAQIVDAGGRLGITTVIDFHSDGFSRYSISGCGSGFPEWSIPPNVRPREPNNGSSCALWPIKAGVSDLFSFSDYSKSVSAFYHNTYGVRTRFIAAWGKIANYFSNNPYIIGYDLLNEPWADERKELAPLYEDVAQAIRAEDSNTVLMIEPFTWAGIGQRSSLPIPSFKNFAFAPHDYDPFAIALKVWITGGIFVDRTLNKDESTAKRLNAPIYMGEYGASGDGWGMAKLVQHYYKAFDRKFISGAQWDISAWTPANKDGWDMEDLSIVDNKGDLRKNFKVRPYPIAVAGEPGEIKEDFHGRSREKFKQLKMSFDWNNQSELGNTDFLIPKDTLGGAPFSVTTRSNDQELSCAFISDTFILTCTTKTDGNKSLEMIITEDLPSN